MQMQIDTDYCNTRRHTALKTQQEIRALEKEHLYILVSFGSCTRDLPFIPLKIFTMEKVIKKLIYISYIVNIRVCILLYSFLQFKLTFSFHFLWYLGFNSRERKQ